MPIEFLNPDGLAARETHHQVAITSGTRTVYLSGQVARTRDGALVGAGDLAAQVEQAYLNVATALAAAGGTFDDVAKLTLYVVDWSVEKLTALGLGIERAAARLGVDPIKPTTLLGIAALADPELLVEVEAIAVLP